MIKSPEEIKRVKEIANTLVSEYYALDISKDTRKREYVTARSMYFKLLRDNTRISFESIARDLNRDHATAMHNIKQIEGYMEFDPSLRMDYIRISNQFNLKLEAEANEDVEDRYQELLSKYNELNIIKDSLISTNMMLQKKIEKLTRYHSIV